MIINGYQIEPGANLRGACLVCAILWGADLEGAKLEGADLKWTNLWGANLKGTILENNS
jgi:uncharacterized protein YjbI with pentapeptide repeats